MCYLRFLSIRIFMSCRTGSGTKIACLLVLAVLFLSQAVGRAPLQEPVSGFFFVIENKKNCPNRLGTHDGTKKFCLPKEPVITESDFESVSEVKYDSVRRQQYVLLNLTPNGLKSLKFLIQRLPESELALVIEDQVAGVFDYVDKNVGRTITITGGASAPDVQWISDRLKKVKP
jgi:hypothetical protein